jgi:GNAT superfamily N-acetyltransferase
VLTTEFLSRDQFSEYGAWLKSQDSETIHLYFGCAIGTQAIDAIVEKFSADPKNNRILVAKIDGNWAGTIHIATHNNEVEFGVIVSQQYRKKGIANRMMDQAITWSRNRFYKDLYMHCISWNRPIKHLCDKHGLTPRNMMGDSQANLRLPPPNVGTYLKEQLNTQRNLLKIIQPPRFINALDPALASPSAALNFRLTP